MTAKDDILRSLSLSPKPLALHEFFIPHSQTSISARLRELKREGKVRSVPVEGKRYTAWVLNYSDELFTEA